MKKEWVDSALTIALLIAVVVSWFIVGWQDARIDTQDRRIEALQGQVDSLTSRPLFIDGTYYAESPAVLARLDRLEARVDYMQAERETADFLKRNGMSPKADIPYIEDFGIIQVPGTLVPGGKIEWRQSERRENITPRLGRH
jgi:hypothetical protein